MSEPDNSHVMPTLALLLAHLAMTDTGASNFAFDPQLYADGYIDLKIHGPLTESETFRQKRLLGLLIQQQGTRRMWIRNTAPMDAEAIKSHLTLSSL